MKMRRRKRRRDGGVGPLTFGCVLFRGQQTAVLEQGGGWDVQVDSRQSRRDSEPGIQLES